VPLLAIVWFFNLVQNVRAEKQFLNLVGKEIVLELDGTPLQVLEMSDLPSWRGPQISIKFALPSGSKVRVALRHLDRWPGLKLSGK